MLDFRQRLRLTRRRYNAYSSRRKLTVAAVSIALLIVGIPVATYAYYAHDIANPDRLMNHNNTGLVLLDKNGKVFYSRGVVKDISQVPLSEVSPSVPKALLASEDSAYYSEPGFSLKGIGRALLSNIKGGDLTGSGGSTITQQLVKNNLLTSHKNILRKYQEVSMAVAIDRKYTKDQVLEMYLNSVYFGSDAFGIESASQTYFGKAAKDLDLAEASMLVGILPAPSAYSPTLGDAKLAKQRQNYVLVRMTQERFITSAQKEAALQEKLNYKPTAEALDGHAQHFALMVIDELNKKYGEERVSRSGLRVTTTIDLEWQKTAEQAVRDRITSLASLDAHNGSLVAIDPRNGEIRALVGSADWENNQFGKVNMVLMPRQPGSSFKPLYYTEAIAEKKLTAATILHDKPTDFGGGYRPTNYDLSYHGDVTARAALADSMNIPAVEVMQKVGVDTAVATAQRMGLKTITQHADKYGLALALGTAEARLLDMTNAYAAFADHGEQFTPADIHEIKNKFGDTIYSYHPKSKKVVDPNASYIMSSILSDEHARYPLAGSRLNIGRPVAVKTGTTNNNKDAWTIGYTPSLVIGVWVGNNDNKPMAGVGGSFGAGPIWRATMLSYLKGTPTEQFEQPDGVIKVLVCNAAGTYNEYFLKGTESDSKCAAPTPVKHDAKEDVPIKEDTKPDPTASPDTPPPATTPPTTQPPTTPPSGSPPPSDGGGGTTPPPSGGGTQPPPSQTPPPNP